jgi:hypothetical protein
MTKKRASLYEQAILAELNSNDTSGLLVHQFTCNEGDPVWMYTLVRGLKPPLQQLISSNQGRGKGTTRGLNDFVLGEGNARYVLQKQSAGGSEQCIWTRNCAACCIISNCDVA